MQKYLIMVNSIAGKMGRLIAEEIMSSTDYGLYGSSLVGDDVTKKCISIWDDTWMIDFYKPKKHRIVLKEYLKFCATENNTPMIIDFTHPTAVNTLAELYCEFKIPFIMGTTGGDREALKQVVLNANIPAIVAPNMAKQIVGFQAMLDFAAENFPGLFEDFDLQITESHQPSKKDVSGTAMAMIPNFNDLGVDCDESNIQSIRDSWIQENFVGVPKKHIDGHAWHKYVLDKSSEGFQFGFWHNINGRDIYIDGVLDAIFYLQKKINEGAVGSFNMIDVLKGK